MWTMSELCALFQQPANHVLRLTPIDCPKTDVREWAVPFTNLLFDPRVKGTAVGARFRTVEWNAMRASEFSLGFAILFAA